MQRLSLIIIMASTSVAIAGVLPLAPGDAATAPAPQAATAPARADSFAEHTIVTNATAAYPIAASATPAYIGPSNPALLPQHTSLDALRERRKDLQSRADVALQASEAFREEHDIAGLAQGPGRLAQSLEELDAAVLEAETQNTRARCELESLEKESATGALTLTRQDQALVTHDPQILAAEAERRALKAQREVLSDSHAATDSALKALDVRIATCGKQIDTLRSRVAARCQLVELQHARDCCTAAQAREQELRALRNDTFLQVRDTDHWQRDYAQRVEHYSRLQAMLCDLGEQIFRAELSKEFPLHTPVPAPAAAGKRLEELREIDHNVLQRLAIVEQTAEAFREAHDIPATPQGVARLPQALARLDRDIFAAANRTRQAALELEHAKQSVDKDGTPSAELQVQIDSDPALADLQADQRTWERDQAVLLAGHEGSDAAAQACAARLAAGANQIETLRHEMAKRLSQTLRDQAQRRLAAAQAEEKDLLARREDALLQARDLDRWLGDCAARNQWLARLERIQGEVEQDILQIELQRAAR